MNNEFRFSDYVTPNKLDVKLPLMANYCSANINVAFQTVGDKDDSLYVYVFKSVIYKQAAPIGDYVIRITDQLLTQTLVCMTIEDV